MKKILFFVVATLVSVASVTRAADPTPIYTVWDFTSSGTLTVIETSQNIEPPVGKTPGQIDGNGTHQLIWGADKDKSSLTLWGTNPSDPGYPIDGKITTNDPAEGALNIEHSNNVIRSYSIQPKHIALNAQVDFSVNESDPLYGFVEGVVATLNLNIDLFFLETENNKYPTDVFAFVTYNALAVDYAYVTEDGTYEYRFAFEQNNFSLLTGTDYELAKGLLGNNYTEGEPIYGWTTSENAINPHGIKINVTGSFTPRDVIPEPATFVLIGLGFTVLPFARRFRNR